MITTQLPHYTIVQCWRDAHQDSGPRYAVWDNTTGDIARTGDTWRISPNPHEAEQWAVDLNRTAGYL